MSPSDRDVIGAERAPSASSGCQAELRNAKITRQADGLRAGYGGVHHAAHHDDEPLDLRTRSSGVLRDVRARHHQRLHPQVFSNEITGILCDPPQARLSDDLAAVLHTVREPDRCSSPALDARVAYRRRGDTSASTSHARRLPVLRLRPPRARTWTLPRMRRCESQDRGTLIADASKPAVSRHPSLQGRRPRPPPTDTEGRTLDGGTCTVAADAHVRRRAALGSTGASRDYQAPERTTPHQGR
jgi:hypothetical protein